MCECGILDRNLEKTKPKGENSMLYDLIEYEVWGNDEDGYEVNDAHTIEKEIYIDEDWSDEKILETIEAWENVEIDNNGSSTDAFYLIDKRNGKPLGELRWA